MAKLSPPATDTLCVDKTGRPIKAGDRVRICTIASLNGIYPVIRADDGYLYFVDAYLPEGEKEPVAFREMVVGFYPSTLEVVD